MASILLTDSKIRGLKPKKSSYYTWQASAQRGVGRLGVKVYPSGRKSFVYRYFINSKEKFITLGDYPTLSLSDATTKASEAALSITPSNPTISQFATVKQLFNDYISDQVKRGKRSYEKTENRLNQVLDSQYIELNTLAKDVTPTHIKLILSEFISRGALAGANKVRANLHAVFNFGLFSDNDPAKINDKKKYGLSNNPVSVVPAQRGADKALDRYLTWEELSIIISETKKNYSESIIHPDYAILLRLCIFTGGQRPWEIMTNFREYWDKSNNTLTVPPTISKNSDYHVIPLCQSAVKTLEEIESRYKKSEYLFPAKTKEGHLLPSEYAKQVKKFCEQTGFKKFTPRDIRRTFKTLAGDMGIALDMRDRLQNHKKPGTSSKHYDRYAYMREKWEIINMWENKLNELLK